MRCVETQIFSFASFLCMLHCHTVTVEKIGGKALPCILDVRDEVAVKAAVKSAVDKVSCVP